MTDAGGSHCQLLRGCPPFLMAAAALPPSCWMAAQPALGGAAIGMAAAAGLTGESFLAGPPRGSLRRPACDRQRNARQESSLAACPRRTTNAAAGMRVAGSIWFVAH